MYYYFLTDFSAILKINGKVLGKIESFLTYQSTADEQIFVEVYPLSITAPPICFLIDDNFITSPPESVLLTDLKGGYFIKFIAPSISSPFKIIAQQKFSFAVITLFQENGLKLSIESPNDMYAQNLFISCESVSITPFTLSGKQLIAIKFGEGKGLLYCFLIDNRISQIFCREDDFFSLEGGLLTRESFSDIAKHTLTTEWELQDITLIKKSVSVDAFAEFCANNLPNHALPFAFFEEFLLSDKIQDFAEPNLLDNLTHLKKYLGNYIGVMPPPIFRNLNEVGLIYAQSQNKYSVDYFTCELLNRKICNIKRSDN